MSDAPKSESKKEKKAAGETSKKAANPLIYVIIFAILFLVALGVLTWTLSVYYKSSQCALDPNIWCSDSWTCQNVCQLADPNTCLDQNGNSVNGCFCSNVTPSGGITGIAKCINDNINNYCTPDACDCPSAVQQAGNCVNGCPTQASAINADTCQTFKG